MTKRTHPQAPRVRTAMAAATLGAASMFLPQWDPDDHWATPERHVVVIMQQVDDEPGFDPIARSIRELIQRAN